MAQYQVKIEDTELPDIFNFDELIENGLLDERDENIKVKLIDSSEWIIARDFPFAFYENSNNIAEGVQEGMTGNYTINEDGTINRPFNKPPKPDNNMIWSIICISVCLPFGILALVESIKVDSFYEDGDYDAAQRASDKSKNWSMWCLWSWLIIIFGIIIISAIANS